MKRRAKTPVSTKIEANKDKIYRISDPIQLAEIFFPAKNAYQKRAAFLAIFFEIKNGRDQKLETTDHIANTYELSPSSVTKARSKMSRLGLIRKREGCWIFSTVFTRTLNILAEKVQTYKSPTHTGEERERELLFVQIAKGINDPEY